MNILVYNGPGVSKTSLTHTLSTLRSLVLPNYTVQTITPRSVASDPWHSNCALFVLPGGRDLPYVEDLKQSNDKIAKYVHNGGSYLGLCAGAYYACRSIEWEVGSEQEVSGPRPLRFFDGVGRGCVYPGFHYESEDGARGVSLMVTRPDLGSSEKYDGLYYNGGGEFVDAESVRNATVIAKYTEGDANGKTAAVHCRVGNGNAVLWGIHPEYPLTLEPAISAIRNTRPDLESSLERLEESRWKLMRETLTLLGLQLPSMFIIKTMQPLPQFLTSSPTLAPAVTAMLEKLINDTVNSNPIILKDNTDNFQFHRGSYSSDLFDRVKDSQVSTPDNPVRNIIVLENGQIPPLEATRAFNIAHYYAELAAAQEERGLHPARTHKIGDVLLYGEVVTSTQTMLDKQVVKCYLLS